MSYEDKEESAALGRPNLLLDFYDDFNNHWRYNSGTENITHLTYVYTPDKCKVSEPEIASNPFNNTIKVELSRGNTFAAPYISAPLESKVSLVIYRLLDAEYEFYWSGVVEDVIFDEDFIPTTTCIPKTTTASRLGERRKCQILCDLVLYGQEIGGCLVDKESFKITGIIDTIDGTTLTSTSFNDEEEGWLQGGEIVIGDARRLIKSHTEESGGVGTIIISRPILNPETATGDRKSVV